MRLKKQKVTSVERGRLVHSVVRGFGHPQSRFQLDQQNVTWCCGHVSETSAKGAALLVADALVCKPTWPQNTTRFYAVDSIHGDDSNTGAPGAPLKSMAALSAVLPAVGAGENVVIEISGDGVYPTVGSEDMSTIEGLTGYGSVTLRGVS